MKLIDGIKLTGKPAQIPDCSRDDLPQFFVDMGFTVGAEIGVAKGAFSVKLAQAGLKLYSIDPWANEAHFGHAKRLLSPYPNCVMIRKTSMEAVEDFADGSLDFVYIDANHEFRYVAEDLVEWSNKVRSGGVISGHDYMYTRPTKPEGICHVIYVLNAYTQAYGIDNSFILGRKFAPPGEKRDRWRSWMFIKP